MEIEKTVEMDIELTQQHLLQLIFCSKSNFFIANEVIIGVQ